MEQNKIIIYQTEDGQTQIDVRMENETVWLTQAQMAELFQTDRTSIVRHINNIYKVEELDRESTCAKIAQVQMEESRKVNINHPDVAEPIMQVLLMEHHSLCYFSCFHGKPAPK